MYQSPPEVEGDALKKGDAELRGNELRSPVEIGGESGPTELEGSHR